MSYSLLGAHVNATVSGMPELFSEWKAPLVVLLDHSSIWHDVKAASPDTVFVGRVYQEFEPNFNDPNFAPRQVAREYCASVLPWAERMGETCRYWQGANEPIVSSSEAMKRFAEFEIRGVSCRGGHLLGWQPGALSLEPFCASAGGGSAARRGVGTARIRLADHG